MSPRPPKLLDQVHSVLRSKHYSHRTETSYVDWIRRYILFHDKRHPLELGHGDIEAFLTHLAVDEEVAASTQNQARSAVLFLYHEVVSCDAITVMSEVYKRWCRPPCPEPVLIST